MEAGTLVLVHLAEPKEQYWGALQSLTPAGVTLRGIDVELFDEWARQVRGGDAELGLVTLFVPMHRVTKIFEDARVGAVGSYGERFYELVGRDVKEWLAAESRQVLTRHGQLN